MSKTLYMRISTQNIACSQRHWDQHMPYIIQLYIMSKQPTKQQNTDQLIWLVSAKKTEAVTAYLIKNSKGEGGRERGGKGGGGGRVLSQAVRRTGRSFMGV